MGWRDKSPASSAGVQGARVQYAALCWRRSAAALDVLLITSRTTGRWIIPKGWPMQGLAPEAAAAQEAWEEAGVRGEVTPLCIGRYGYQKLLSVQTEVPCAVAVYGLQVQDLADDFPEVRERRRLWVAQDVAATLVDEPDLAQLIAGFVPQSTDRPTPIAGEDAARTAKRPITLR
jgi:8-oxo-dGTP pyrophosphatase MutT (NUDIX family)